jgi:hypothetical protein
MAMQHIVDRPRCHVSLEWPQTDEEDRCPNAAYQWDWVALTHATQTRAYIQYNNELDVWLCTCFPFLIVVTL